MNEQQELASLIPIEHRRQIDIVPIEFTRDHIEDPKKPGELQEVHTVTWVKRGSNGTSQTVRVDRLRAGAEKAAKLPHEQRIQNTDLMIWSVCEEPYQYWLKGQEPPVSGTALDAWAGVTKGQIDMLRRLQMRSIEDVAEMNDSAMNAFGMGGRVIRDKARAFVAAKDKSASAGEVARLQEQLAHQAEELAEMRALLDSVTKPKADEPPKRTLSLKKAAQEDEAA